MEAAVPINPESTPVPIRFLVVREGRRPLMRMRTASKIIIPKNRERESRGIRVKIKAPNTEPPILPITAHFISCIFTACFSRKNISEVRNNAVSKRGPGINSGFNSTSKGAQNGPIPNPTDP